MEQNNFKLFEILNETINDIYDFVLRYLRTLGLSIFRPKVFITTLSEEKPYKKVVRPYNFILFSFIILVLGIEFVKEPIIEAEQALFIEQNEIERENFDDREAQLEQKKEQEDNEVKETAQLMDQILGLDTKSLVSRFLPALLLFILISKLIENALRKIFKNEVDYGDIYIYGIGSSCSVFALILMLIYAGERVDWSSSLSFEFIAGLVISIFSISFIMIIFPAFIIARALKVYDIKFFRRSAVFLVLMLLNFTISTGYVYVLIPSDEPVEQAAADEDYITDEDFYEDVNFELDEIKKTDNGLILDLSHFSQFNLEFKQGSYTWIDATEFFEEPTAGLFGASATFYNKSRDDSVYVLKSGLNNELTLNIENPIEYAVFDSLFYENEYFLIELPLTDEYGYFRYGVIEINPQSLSANNIDLAN